MVLRCVEELLHSLTFYLFTIDFYFCNAEDEEIKILEDYLDIYGEASSQLINSSSSKAHPQVRGSKKTLMQYAGIV